MSALVTQVLEPTIGNYFRNAAQGSDIIDFLKNRSLRQGEARDSISLALKEYNVGAVDTLIGDIVPPDALMKTLTDRKLAEQERVTYETQRLAQVVRQQFEQANALAVTQAKVVDAERQVAIADFNAQANVKSAEGQARAKTINAEADATVTRTVGDAEASKDASGRRRGGGSDQTEDRVDGIRQLCGRASGRSPGEIRCQVGAGHCRRRRRGWRHARGCVVGQCDQGKYTT
jgi:uncharacterized membrane protein YqiK